MCATIQTCMCDVYPPTVCQNENHSTTTTTTTKLNDKQQQQQGRQS